MDGRELEGKKHLELNPSLPSLLLLPLLLHSPLVKACTKAATNFNTLSATATPFLTGKHLSKQATKASVKANSPVSFGGPFFLGVVTNAACSWILRRRATFLEWLAVEVWVWAKI